VAVIVVLPLNVGASLNAVTVVLILGKLDTMEPFMDKEEPRLLVELKPTKVMEKVLELLLALPFKAVTLAIPHRSMTKRVTL
jgi:hypothetical protein